MVRTPKTSTVYPISIGYKNSYRVWSRQVGRARWAKDNTLLNYWWVACLGIALSTTYETECRPERWVQRWVNHEFNRMLLILLTVWRRGRDSNPRNLTVRLISSQVHSTTLPPLRVSHHDFEAPTFGSLHLLRLVAAERWILAHRFLDQVTPSARPCRPCTGAAPRAR